MNDVTAFTNRAYSYDLLFSPCHYPTDDLIYGSGQKLQIASSLEPTKATRQCTLDDEQIRVSNGRWVRYPFPDESLCSPMTNVPRTGFRNPDFIASYTGDMPLTCWHRDDISQIGNACAEMHCSETVNHRYFTSLKEVTKWYGLWEPYKCVYRDLTNEEIQACFSTKNIANVDIMGASISEILKEYLSQMIESL